MDYLYHGANTIDEYRQQIREINKVLENGKLPLTKWISIKNGYGTVLQTRLCYLIACKVYLFK